MLIDNFYSIKHFESGPHKIVASLCINDKHPVFQGHFPDQPIVPGVIQLQLIKECMENALKNRFFIQSIDQAKYIQMISPLQHPNIEVEISYALTEEGHFKIVASISSGTSTFTKVKAVLSVLL